MEEAHRFTKAGDRLRTSMQEQAPAVYKPYVVGQDLAESARCDQVVKLAYMQVSFYPVLAVLLAADMR